MIDIKERICVLEKTLEIPKEKLFNDNCRTRDIISVQTSELSIGRKPLNAIAVSSIENVSYIIKHVLPNSKYTIMACDKLTNELNPYADVVVQLKDDDTLDIIKETSK